MEGENPLNTKGWASWLKTTIGRMTRSNPIMAKGNPIRREPHGLLHQRYFFLFISHVG